MKYFTVFILLLAAAGVGAGADFPAKTKAITTTASIEMVHIPGCNFVMGKYEVTQKQYADVMGTNPSYFKNKLNNPVEQVSWYSAVEFCNKLSKKEGLKPYYTIDKNKKDPMNMNGDDDPKWTVTINGEANGYRLPTSAEWEYACSAGTTTRYYWGDSDEFSIVDQYAVYDKNSSNKGVGHKDYGTHRVGTKKPNAWGIYDISGNVFEWCYDWRPDLGASCRVIRGGGWGADAGFLQSGYVVDWDPISERGLLGFRLARTL